MMRDEQETEATEQAVNHGRRSAMKKITLGVGVLAGYSLLPETWTRPIIGQIVLPAHAATSGSSLHDPCAVEVRGGDHTTANVIIKVTGFVTPPVANLPVVITATPVLSGVKKTDVKANTTTSANGTFEAIMTIGGGPGITSINVTTSVTGADGVANCVVHTTATSSPSGVCSESAVLGRWHVEGTERPNYPEATLTLATGGIATNVIGGGGSSQPNGRWSKSGDVLTINLSWVDDETGERGTDTYVLTLGSNCRTGSGTLSVTASNGETGSMGATGSMGMA
jgi:hypothetical protein